jgi:hypothetical protein
LIAHFEEKIFQIGLVPTWMAVFGLLVVPCEFESAIVPETSSMLLYADHVERCGVDFFRLACERDLEGTISKRKAGVYGEAWFKIRNPVYSQYEGRRELFEQKYAIRQ